MSALAITCCVALLGIFAYGAAHVWDNIYTEWKYRRMHQRALRRWAGLL